MQATIEETLEGIDLAWWPEFLLDSVMNREEDDRFTAALARLSACLAEEESLA